MTGTPGRPLSAELSEQLVAVAVDILAEEGWGRLNSDRIAARARAGKAGIYRRWPTMAALAEAWAPAPGPDDAAQARLAASLTAALWTAGVRAVLAELHQLPAGDVATTEQRAAVEDLAKRTFDRLETGLATLLDLPAS